VTRRLVLREEALSDVESAASWYDDQQPGLGDDFVTEARKLFQQIAEQPTRFRTVSNDIRRGSLQRVPYIAYFFVDAEQVLILTVVHKRRHPETWRLRIRS
jgi:plasmid stabilization system protein ParE